jgi:hypothetical protein
MAVSETGIGETKPDTAVGIVAAVVGNLAAVGDVDTAAASASGRAVDAIGVEPGIGVVMNLNQTVKQNSATFPGDKRVAEISGSTSQTSSYVDVDSWPIETEPDFQVFMAYVDSAFCTFNEEETLLQEDYCTMRELFPACVEQLNEGRWWRRTLQFN